MSWGRGGGWWCIVMPLFGDYSGWGVGVLAIEVSMCCLVESG